MFFAAVLAIVSAAPLSAGQPPQAAPPPAPPGGPEAAVTAGQIQRFFEAFTVLQAQEALQLSETQYGRFVTRFKAVQDTRRKHQVARNQIMAELRRLTNPQNGTNDEPSLTERLRALRDEDDRAAVDL